MRQAPPAGHRLEEGAFLFSDVTVGGMFLAAIRAREDIQANVLFDEIHHIADTPWYGKPPIKAELSIATLAPPTTTRRREVQESLARAVLMQSRGAMDRRNRREPVQLAERPGSRSFVRLVVNSNFVNEVRVQTFIVRAAHGTLLGRIELSSDGPAGERYIARLRNLEGGIEGRVYAGNDRIAAHAAIEDTIKNICEGAALWRQRQKSVLH